MEKTFLFSRVLGCDYLNLGLSVFLNGMGGFEADFLKLVEGFLVVGFVVRLLFVVDDLVEVDGGEELVFGGLCLSI